MARKSFKFKSSGIRKSDIRKLSEPDVIRNKPIGLKTPLSFGNSSTSLFETHTIIPKQLADNLRNLILTNSGERLGRPGFGANLRSLLFDLGSTPAFIEQARQKIDENVKKFIPQISITDVERIEEFSSNTINIKNSSQGRDSVGLIFAKIKVTYNIKILNLTNQIIEVFLYAGG